MSAAWDMNGRSAEIPCDGDLMSYGPDLDETFDRVAALVDRVLKGAKPAELPFEQPTTFHFALNLSRSASKPRRHCSRANEVIE